MLASKLHIANRAGVIANKWWYNKGNPLIPATSKNNIVS